MLRQTADSSTPLRNDNQETSSARTAHLVSRSRSILSRVASYRPKSEIVISEPCSESWEKMHGDSRVRHCTECDKRVHNLAALTSAQIEHLIDSPGPLPCMRIARFADGSLLVAEEQRNRPPYGLLAGAAMAGLLALSARVASTQQTTMGRIAMRTAIYSGRVVDSLGKPVPQVEVTLIRSVAGRIEQAKSGTDANGEFEFSVAPGDWTLSADSAAGSSGAYGVPLHLNAGSQKADKPITLRPITVTAGVPAIVPSKK